MPRGDLPCIDRAGAETLLNDIAAMLVNDLGWKLAGGSSANGNGAGGHQPADRALLEHNIRSGVDAHDSMCSLAASLAAHGWIAEQIRSHLRALWLEYRLKIRNDDRDAAKRWEERWQEIGRTDVSSICEGAVRKYAPAERPPAHPGLDPRAPGLQEPPHPGNEPINITASQFTLRAATEIERRPWLYARHYIRGFVSATIGKTKIGKSGLTFGELLSMVTGKEIFRGQKVAEPLRGWYIGEDPADEIERRLVAACTRHKITAEQIGDRLFVDSTRKLKHLRIARLERGKVIIDHAALAAIAAECKRRKIDVLILDTLNKFHTLPENSSEITELMRALSELAEECNIAIDVLHHTRKQAPGTMTAVTADDARGSSAIIGDVRSSRVLNPMTKDEAVKARLAEDERWRYLRLDGAGANMAPPTAAQWLRHHSEILPCGESVEVTEPWEYPKPFDDVSAKDMETARALAAEGTSGSGDKYRADSRADDWFGYALAKALPHLGLTPKEVDKDNNPTPKAQADRAQLNAIIKTWTMNKALKKMPGQDPKTRKRADFIYPGDFGEADDKVVDISQRLPQPRDNIDPEDQI